MATLQDTFNTYAGNHYEGQLIDSGMSDIITRIAEEDIKFGQPVVIGSSDQQCKLATDAGDKFLGVAMRTGVQNLDDGTPGYKKDSVISIVRVGRVAVKVAKAAIDGNEVSYKVTAASGNTPKKVEFQGTAASGDVLITGAYHAEVGTSGTIVAIQLNGSNTLTAKS